ncbi:nuclear transport factor 2 family protein [Streptomyces sp. NPDC086777]|uniref:YybH family protein n=1 Tax=Streptomyces sp. NPDC086777 TaxID=3154866 RepID=UPI00344C9524
MTASTHNAGTPEELNTLNMQAFQRRDLDALVSLYHPEARLQPSPGTVVVGEDAIREGLKEVIDSGTEVDLELQHIQQVGDVATLWNVLTLTAPDGTVTRQETTEVVQRQIDGRWQYLIDVIGQAY